MFRRNCFLTSWFDPVAPFLEYVGAENILWAGKLPLATSPWPKTRESIESAFRGVSSEAREKILWRNAAQLYRL